MIQKKSFLFIALAIVLLGISIHKQVHAESDVEDFFEDLFGITDNYLVVVDGKTDFLPGTEFNQARVSVDGGNVRTMTVGASANALEGIRLAEYELRENSTYRIKVELIKPDGNVLEGGTREISLRLGENNTVVTALIARPAPAPEDEPAAAQVMPGLVNTRFAGSLFNQNIPLDSIRDGFVFVNPDDPASSAPGSPAGAVPTAPDGARQPTPPTDSGSVARESIPDAGPQADPQNSQGAPAAQAASGEGASCSLHASGRTAGSDGFFICLGVLLILSNLSRNRLFEASGFDIFRDGLGRRSRFGFFLKSRHQAIRARHDEQG